MTLMASTGEEGLSEIEKDCGCHVPGVGAESGIVTSLERFYGIAESESIASGNLDEIDYVKTDSYVPSGLYVVGGYRSAMVVVEPHQKRRPRIDERREQIMET